MAGDTTGRRRGRPPKPHGLKVIEGNPGKRKLVEPPKAPPSRPRCPAWLTPYAKTVWKRVVPELDAMGILAQIDRDTLATYCLAVARLKSATETYAKTGDLVKGQKGEAVKNPILQLIRDASRDIATFSSMFGLSPSDRVRLGPAVIHHVHGSTLEEVLNA